MPHNLSLSNDFNYLKTLQQIIFKEHTYILELSQLNGVFESQLENSNILTSFLWLGLVKQTSSIQADLLDSVGRRAPDHPRLVGLLPDADQDRDRADRGGLHRCRGHDFHPLLPYHPLHTGKIFFST